MKLLSGIVVSNKQTKTIVVEIERFFRHPIYERRIRRTKRYQVHTDSQHNVGDRVRFLPTKPISKMKKWKVVVEKKQKVESTKQKETKKE